MKKIITLIYLIFSLVSSTIQACNHSSYTLNSVTQSGSVYTVNSVLCIGYGRTGLTYGANGNTGWYFNLAIYGNCSPIYHTPTITGPNPPNVTYGSVLAGFPNAYGYGEDEDIIYYDTTGNDANITCIATTLGCGTPGGWCIPIRIDFNGCLPDSIRAYGIEGYGSCDMESDMIIVFSVLPIDIPKPNIEPIRNGSGMTSTEYFSLLGSSVGSDIDRLSNGLYEQITRNQEGIIISRKKIFKFD